jgi:hypothetical protein
VVLDAFAVGSGSVIVGLDLVRLRMIHIDVLVLYDCSG